MVNRPSSQLLTFVFIHAAIDPCVKHPSTTPSDPAMEVAAPIGHGHQSGGPGPGIHGVDLWCSTSPESESRTALATGWRTPRRNGHLTSWNSCRSGSSRMTPPRPRRESVTKRRGAMIRAASHDLKRFPEDDVHRLESTLARFRDRPPSLQASGPGPRTRPRRCHRGRTAGHSCSSDRGTPPRRFHRRFRRH